ncbi:DUF2065 domain-containing protein [Colwellia hornerae]|uniref:DUF2065 domain-containing protein n=1 Tax=Colwellia hornerae TaxID=89402 RepID=A0A5C6QHR2_9GAMM|nr:DUF2065 domain-containing protein [Colwellia hornerae]TWX52445.1 DUF2065 domain-containing protein [Colwellia hornerae]TWX58274.1 DUF2065 domain-containing protein [Colwellia hornerae]TWX68381.1 DUF2065 domain-containing protein [Colwellia hornerae]
MIETLITAFALVLITDGLIPALFPNKWRDTMETLAQQFFDKKAMTCHGFFVSAS